jgi:hypothetical protein
MQVFDYEIVFGQNRMHAIRCFIYDYFIVTIVSITGDNVNQYFIYYFFIPSLYFITN